MTIYYTEALDLLDSDDVSHGTIYSHIMGGAWCAGCCDEACHYE